MSVAWRHSFTSSTSSLPVAWCHMCSAGYCLRPAVGKGCIAIVRLALPSRYVFGRPSAVLFPEFPLSSSVHSAGLGSAPAAQHVSCPRFDFTAFRLCLRSAWFDLKVHTSNTRSTTFSTSPFLVPGFSSSARPLPGYPPKHEHLWCLQGQHGQYGSHLRGCASHLLGGWAQQFTYAAALVGFTDTEAASQQHLALS